MTPQSELVTRWRDLLTRYNTLACDLDRALQSAHGIGLSGFEVLDRLADKCRVEAAEQPDPHGSRCRMPDLAEDMYLSQSALSRTVARLEKDGLVVRTMCDLDRRAITVQLTDAGRERHAEAQPTHRAVLAEHLQ